MTYRCHILFDIMDTNNKKECVYNGKNLLSKLWNASC